MFLLESLRSCWRINAAPSQKRPIAHARTHGPTHTHPLTHTPARILIWIYGVKHYYANAKYNGTSICAHNRITTYLRLCTRTILLYIFFLVQRYFSRSHRVESSLLWKLKYTHSIILCCTFDVCTYYYYYCYRAFCVREKRAKKKKSLPQKYAAPCWSQRALYGS